MELLLYKYSTFHENKPFLYSKLVMKTGMINIMDFNWQVIEPPEYLYEYNFIYQFFKLGEKF